MKAIYEPNDMWKCPQRKIFMHVEMSSAEILALIAI
jgi:hypothetical protein